MQNEKNLNVTFSKRRNGLFKKASEISILCGAEVATVIYPKNSVYSIGNPSSIQLWIGLGVNPPPDAVVPNTSSKPHQNAYVDERQIRSHRIWRENERSENRGEMLDEALSTDVSYENHDFQLQKLRLLKSKLKEANRLAHQKGSVVLHFLAPLEVPWLLSRLWKILCLVPMLDHPNPIKFVLSITLTF
ncbi:hypothetical protein HAX54_012173 [Datura stramonium]|uniref:MADS-box domain-containing protein n=1 Tax=Datura stramonium TaxID=4076 RepID=A0ABS8TM41_DATST|nr:hypothetical protein [Datura stramonium]